MGKDILRIVVMSQKETFSEAFDQVVRFGDIIVSLIKVPFKPIGVYRGW